LYCLKFWSEGKKLWLEELVSENFFVVLRFSIVLLIIEELREEFCVIRKLLLFNWEFANELSNKKLLKSFLNGYLKNFD